MIVLVTALWIFKVIRKWIIFIAYLCVQQVKEASCCCSSLRSQIIESYWKAKLILATRSNSFQIATCPADLPLSNWNVVINFLHRSDVTCCVSKGSGGRREGGLLMWWWRWRWKYWDLPGELPLIFVLFWQLWFFLNNLFLFFHLLFAL